jgi:hypothetical protein
MKVRYPINITSDNSDNIEQILNGISKLLNATKVLEVSQGVKIDDVNFIGPYNLVKDLYAKHSNDSKTSLLILIDENAKSTGHDGNQKIIANGVYLPSDYQGNCPFLMLYKRVDVLDGKPVLISENYLTPGELAVVPETSELFAVLFYNNGQVCQIPDEVKWFSWYSDEEQDCAENIYIREYKINYEDEYAKNGFRDGQLITLNQPLLSCSESDFSCQLMDLINPVIHITPILASEELEELLQELQIRSIWTRRTGENNILYTQETFDIWEYSKKHNSPKIFKDLISKLESDSLLKVIRKLTGSDINALREVCAFHMKSNEFITKHADSSLGGQLLVRFNWLLQSPRAREYDLRFWKGESTNEPITRYKAIQNSATIFYLGDLTPHDLTPLPEDCDQDRYNLVITFGDNTK